MWNASVTISSHRTFSPGELHQKNNMKMEKISIKGFQLKNVCDVILNVWEKPMTPPLLLHMQFFVDFLDVSRE